MFTFGCQLISFGYRAFHAINAGCQYYFSAECPEQRSAFHAHGFGHGKDEFVTFNGRHHRQSYSGISAGGFNDYRARFEQPALLCIFNHCQRNTFLNATGGIEGLNLYDYICQEMLAVRIIAQLQQRRITNQFGEFFRYFCHIILCYLFVEI